MTRQRIATIALLIVAGIASITHAGDKANKEGIIFQDGFESGDKSKTSKDGFKWSKTKVVSVATAKKVVWTKDKKASLPLGKGDWTPKTGKHAMHFLYEKTTGTWIEQGFSLGKAYPELWIRFWLRVPLNYKHTEKRGRGNNNKMLAIWMDGYSTKGEGPSAVWEMWPSRDGGSKLAIHYSKGNHTGGGGHMQHQTLVRVPQDRGRWMQLVFRVRKSSKSGAKDGVMQLWRRWDGEKTYTQLHDVRNAEFYAPTTTPFGWQKGYLLGWANAKYDVDTTWMVDDFTLATKPLIPRNAMKKRRN